MGQRTRRGEHHHKEPASSARPGICPAGCSTPGADVPEPDDLVVSAQRSARAKLKTPPSTTATSYPSATTATCSTTLPPSPANHQLQRAANPGNSPSTPPSSAASSNCPARPSHSSSRNQQHPASQPPRPGVRAGQSPPSATKIT